MHGELKWFLILFLALWLAWAVTGGPQRNQINRTHPFIKRPDPTDDGKVYTFKELQDQTRP